MFYVVPHRLGFLFRHYEKPGRALTKPGLSQRRIMLITAANEVSGESRNSAADATRE